MRIEIHPCHILHSRKYRETSLILDVFSVEHGRLSVIAKGGRKDKNNKRALMQPAREVNMAWTIRRDMGTLTAIEPAGLQSRLTGRLLIAIFYINELLIKLLHQHEPHAELYSAYKHVISALAKGESEETVLRVFEKRLLESLGYGLLLASDAEGHEVKKEEYYSYQAATGPTLCRDKADHVLRYSGATLLGLYNEELTEANVIREAKVLMRLRLSDLLGDKRLASRDLYRDYLRDAINHTN